MQLLATTKQLIDYRDQLDRQQTTLAFCDVFTQEQRNDLFQIYSNAIAICNTRIAQRTNSIIEQIYTSCI